MPSLLANLLRRMRKKTFPKESMSAVAHRLGVDHFYLSKLESGAIKKPTLEVLKQMADIYKCGLGDADYTLRQLLEGMSKGKIAFEDEDSLLTPLVSEAFQGRTSTLTVRRMFSDTIPEGLLREDSTSINLIAPSSILGTMLIPGAWMHQSFALDRFKRMFHETPCRLYMAPTLSDSHAVTPVGRVENHGDLFLLSFCNQGCLATALDIRINEFNEQFDRRVKDAYTPEEAIEVTREILRLPILHEHYHSPEAVVAAEKKVESPVKAKKKK